MSLLALQEKANNNVIHVCIPHTASFTLTAKGEALSTSNWRLSDQDRESYGKTFSSIVVPYTSIEIGKEIGQGIFVYAYTLVFTKSILIIGAFSTVYMGKIQRPDTGTSEDIAVKTAKSEFIKYAGQ